MTQLQLVLDTLDKSPRGLTAAELHDRTRIPRNTLATLIWQLRKDGYLQRVGGHRGAYQYGITAKGKEQLNSDLDPLTRLGQLVNEHDAASFDAMLTVIRDLDSYKQLTKFVQWLITNYRDVIRDIGPETEDRLHDAVLTYLGVDAETFKKQRESLEAILSLTRG